MPSETQLLNWARNVDGQRDKEPGFLHTFAHSANLDPQIFYDILPSIEGDDWGPAELLSHQVSEQKIIDILIDRATTEGNLQAREVLDYVQALDYYTFSPEQESRLGKDPELPSPSRSHKLKAQLTTVKAPEHSSSSLSNHPGDLSDSSDTSGVAVPIYGKISMLDEARAEMPYAVSQRLMNALNRNGGLHELVTVLRSGELKWATTPFGDAGVKPLKGFDDSFEYKQYVVGEQRVLGNEIDVEGTKVLIFFKYSSHTNIANYHPNYNLPSLALLDKGFDNPAFVNFGFDKEQQVESLPTYKLLAQPPKPLAQKITEPAPSSTLKEPNFLGLDSSRDDKLFEASIRDHPTLENEIAYHAQCITGQALYLYKADTFYIRVRLLIEASSTGQLKDQSFKDFGILLQYYIETFAKKSAGIDENSESIKHLLEECKKIQSLLNKNPNSKNIDSSLLQNLQDQLENIEDTLAGFNLAHYAKLIAEEQNANKETVQSVCTYFTNKALTITQQEYLTTLRAYLTPKPTAPTITASPLVPPSPQSLAHPSAEPPTVLALPQPNVNTLKDRIFSDISTHNLACTISHFIAFTRYNACLSAHMIIDDKHPFKNAIDALCSTDNKTEEWWKWGYMLIQYGKFSLIVPLPLALVLTGIKGMIYTAARWMLVVEHDNIISALKLGACVGISETWATKNAAVFTIAKLGKMTLTEANEICSEASLLSPAGLGNVIVHASSFAANYLITHGKTIILQPASEESIIIYSIPWIAACTAFVALSLFGGYGLIAALYVALRTFDIASLIVNFYVYSQYSISNLAAEMLFHMRDGNNDTVVSKLDLLEQSTLQSISKELAILHMKFYHQDNELTKAAYEILKILKDEHEIMPQTPFQIIGPDNLDNLEWFTAAIIHGDIDAVKEFVIEHPTIYDRQHANAETYFFLAFCFRHINVFEVLIEHAKTSTATMEFILMLLALDKTKGTTKFILQNTCAIATESEIFPYVKTVLGAGINPNYVNKDGLSCICGAALYGLPSVAKLLIDYGADITQKCDDDGKDLIYIAINRNFYNVAVVFITSGFRMCSAGELKEKQASNLAKHLNDFLDANIDDAYGATCACSAIINLQDEHIGITRPTRCTAMTSQALDAFELVQNGNLEAVKVFVQAHPEFLYFDYKFLTLIAQAIKHKQHEIFSWMLSYQKTLNHKHIKQATIMHIMAMNLYAATTFLHGGKYIRALLHNGADPNLDIDVHPLHMAAQKGSIQNIYSLIMNNAKINRPFSSKLDGMPLDDTINNNHLNAAVFLVLHGAHIERTIFFSIYQHKNDTKFSDFINELTKRATNMQEEALEPLVNVCLSISALKSKNLLKDKIPPVCAGALLAGKGNFKQAEIKYKSAAEKGDMESMYRLGKLYENQNKKDEAIALYEKAASKGHFLSQWALIFKKEYAAVEKIKITVELADKGFGLAMISRAAMFIENAHIEEGKAMLIKSCDNIGLSDGCELLQTLEECEDKNEGNLESIVTCFKNEMHIEGFEQLSGAMRSVTENIKAHLG